MIAVSVPPPVPAAVLPFDPTCPVFHDNDDHRDVYTEEYLMAVAHLGKLKLVGLTTTYAPNAREYGLFVLALSCRFEISSGEGAEERGRMGEYEMARQVFLLTLPASPPCARCHEPPRPVWMPSSSPFAPAARHGS